MRLEGQKEKKIQCPYCRRTLYLTMSDIKNGILFGPYFNCPGCKNKVYIIS